MAVSRRALRFNRVDSRVGVDSLLANNYGRDPGCDFPACKVSEGASIVLDSEVWVAFLDGVCGARLASSVNRHLTLRTFLHGEALSGKGIPQNVQPSQSHGRH